MALQKGEHYRCRREELTHGATPKNSCSHNRPRERRARSIIKVAATPEDAVEAAKALGGEQWMVKAQIHAGGRGKAGGVKFCKSLDDVKAAAAGMLGKKMETYQSGGRALPGGVISMITSSSTSGRLWTACTWCSICTAATWSPGGCRTRSTAPYAWRCSTRL